MTLTPINTNAARDARGRVRLFAAPVFIRPDGRRWLPIAEAVKVRHDPASQAFVIAFGEKWIRLAPQRPAELASASAGTIVQGRCFGHILKAGHRLSRLAFDVTTSTGVERDADGWTFGPSTLLGAVSLSNRAPDGSFDPEALDGVKIGLCLRDWQRRFGPAMTQSVDGVTLDIAPSLAGKELNLDPTTVWSSNDHQHVPSEDASWATVRGAASSDHLDDPGLGLGAWLWGEAYDIRRSLVRFDTSGYAVTKAEFFVFAHLPFPYDPPDMRWAAGEDLAGVNFGTPQEYPALLLDGVSDALAIVNDPDDGWRKADVTAVFAATDKFDVVLGEGWDADDVTPTGVRMAVFDTSVGDSPPYLELTLAGSGGGTRRTMTGVGT